MLTNIFNCPICYKPYDESGNLPKILVSCGHTFCLSCMNQTLQKDAAFVCSFCPSSFIRTTPELDSLPTNLFVMGQLTSINLSSSPSIKMLSSPEKADYPLCPLHNHKLKFVCLTDELLICKFCIRFGVHKGHNVLHVQDVKSEALKKINQLTAIAQDLQDNQKQSSPKTEAEDLKQLIQTNFDSSLHLKKMLKVKEEEFLEEIDRFFDLEVENLLQKKHNDENTLQQIRQQVHTLNRDTIDSHYFTSLNQDLIPNIQVYRIPQYLTCLAKTAMKNFESLSSRLSNKVMTFDCFLEPLSHQESIAVSKNFKVFPRFLQTLFSIQEGTLILDFSAIQFEQELIKSFSHLCSRANDLLFLELKFNSSNFLETLALRELCEMGFWNHSQLKALKIQVQGHEKCNSGLEKLLITTANLKNLESFSLIVPDTEIHNSVLKAVSEFPLKKNKSLQELELNFAKTQIDSEGFLELMPALSSIISRLKRFYLNLNGTQVKAISDFIKFQLSKSHHLQSLSLCLESVLITKSFWRAVASIPQNFSTSLKNVVLDFRNTRIDDNDFKILHSSFIENATYLQTFELYFSFTSLTDESLKLICQTLMKIAKNLQKIVLDFSHTKIKEIGTFIDVIPKFVLLETFELNLKKNSLNKKTVQQIYSEFLSNKVAMSHLKHFKIKLSKNLKKSVKILANSINDELHKINNE